MTSLKVPQSTQVVIQETNPNYFIINWNQEDNSLTLTSPVEGFQMIESLNLAADFDQTPESVKVNYYNPNTQEFIVCYKFPNTAMIYEILKKK